MQLIKDNKYAVLEKSDGERMMMIVEGVRACLVDRKFGFWECTHEMFLSALGKGQGTLLDGELIVSNGKVVYLMYDIVMLNGHYVGDKFLKERLKQMTEVRSLIRQCGNTATALPFEIRRKNFVPKELIHEHLNNIKLIGDEYVFSEKRSDFLFNHKNDGLIFTPEDEPYIPSVNRPILKWKWPNLNSVDFKVIYPYFSKKSNFQNLVLYCGASTSFGNVEDVIVREITVPEKTKNWVHHTFPDHDGSSAIIECVYDSSSSNWLVKKARPDKDTANFLHVVVSTLETVIDAVTTQELCKVCNCQACYPRN